MSATGRLAVMPVTRTTAVSQAAGGGQRAARRVPGRATAAGGGAARAPPAPRHPIDGHEHQPKRRGDGGGDGAPEWTPSPGERRPERGGEGAETGERPDEDADAADLPVRIVDHMVDTAELTPTHLRPPHEHVRTVG